ncbi:nucleotide exchange factor GrpE [Patescibacteria group bacterium]
MTKDKKEDEVQTQSTSDNEFTALKKKADEYLAGWQRAKADYLNYKKQVEKEKEELAKFATVAMILDFLPLHTNFKRAAEHIPENEKEKDWVKGIIAIKKQLDDMLSNLNIKEVETKHFNPWFHEAVEHRPSDKHKPNDIIGVVEPGYQMQENIIQAAKVIVAAESKKREDNKEGGVK